VFTLRGLTPPLLMLLLTASVATGQEAEAATGAQQPTGQGPPQPYEYIYVELFFGGNWPVGSSNEPFDPSFLAGGRVETDVTARLPQIRAGFQISYHAFDAEGLTAGDNQGAINVSGFGKVYTQWGPYKPFGLLGLGVYSSKLVDATRRWDPGFQIGGGVEAPVTEHVALLVGTGLQIVIGRGDEDALTWIDGYIGFVFRQP
jgi:hypothetical protein